MCHNSSFEALNPQVWGHLESTEIDLIELSPQKISILTFRGKLQDYESFRVKISCGDTWYERVDFVHHSHYYYIKIKLSRNSGN